MLILNFEGYLIGKGSPHHLRCIKIHSHGVFFCSYVLCVSLLFDILWYKPVSAQRQTDHQINQADGLWRELVTRNSYLATTSIPRINDHLSF